MAFSFLLEFGGAGARGTVASLAGDPSDGSRVSVGEVSGLEHVWIGAAFPRPALEGVGMFVPGFGGLSLGSGFRVDACLSRTRNGSRNVSGTRTRTPSPPPSPKSVDENT